MGRFLCLAIVLTLFLASGSIATAGRRGRRFLDPRSHKVNRPAAVEEWENVVDFETEECSGPNRQIRAPKKNLWDSLGNLEVSQLYEWLYDEDRGLNLTHHENATHWDNFIGVAEVLHPNKTDVLDYLDNDGPIPIRYARVVIFQGASENPYLHEIMVLHIPQSLRWHRMLTRAIMSGRWVPCQSAGKRHGSH